MAEGAEELRGAIHAFIRRFGLLEQARTPCGVPMPISHAHALIELRRTPEMTQQELAARLALSKSNVSRLVDRLAAAGRIRRKRDGCDGRACRVTLTEKGRRLADHLQERSLDRHRALMANLSPSRRAAVIEALRLLAEACDGWDGKGEHQAPRAALRVSG